jgi:hypothetical protein
MKLSRSRGMQVRLARSPVRLVSPDRGPGGAGIRPRGGDYSFPTGRAMREGPESRRFAQETLRGGKSSAGACWLSLSSCCCWPVPCQARRADCALRADWLPVAIREHLRGCPLCRRKLAARLSRHLLDAADEQERMRRMRHYTPFTVSLLVAELAVLSTGCATDSRGGRGESGRDPLGRAGAGTHGMRTGEEGPDSPRKSKGCSLVLSGLYAASAFCKYSKPWELEVTGRND